MLNVLFLCTGNSARSIFAEAILNRVGADKLIAYSAGSHPKGAVHPQALELLKQLNYPVGDLRSRSWDLLAKPNAPEMGFVFTVCDNAAGEACPLWPVQPMTAHRGVPDTAAATGSPTEIALAFAETYRQLDTRIGIFARLSIANLDRVSLQTRLRDIGTITKSPLGSRLIHGRDLDRPPPRGRKYWRRAAALRGDRLRHHGRPA